ncbi:four-carbon acid sugar kinase family protein [uncultured Desulfosarcina sp.]|uniref:four-carbon acid sugar kinase family protein n=1 Tax=uncultured Desulfosarcina sp. TaxID=218289 RepID=UPI0029C7C5B1|nr:four-carbon acid sugar kinase family protein [uncultured Desulfosarcina sp.]
MNRVVHIAVIADDITGAADTGAQFCPAVGPVYMAGAADGDLTAAAVHTAGLAVFTNTRHTEAARAATIVGRAAEKIRGLFPRMVYKKIDSCLRGNLGAEIDSLLQATGATASFVAPAFPQQGRTTVNDHHLINGVPLAETEIGHDPLCPVRESRLSVLLSAQSRMPVGHVDLACIEKGPAELAERVRSLLNGGCRNIVFDAEQTVHLDAVASLARDHFENILLAGSAGLAGSLSRMMAGNLQAPAAADRPRIKKWLFVCGSASRVLADQVAMLARTTGWAHVAMDPLTLASGEGSVCREPFGAALVDVWAAGSLILSIQPIQKMQPTEKPDHVVQGLAKVAADLLTDHSVDGFFLSGGDTAEAFWHQIGANGLLIREEILPGLMRGEFVGGMRHGLPVITKAGAFGKVDTLKQLINSLK